MPKLSIFDQNVADRKSGVKKTRTATKPRINGRQKGAAGEREFASKIQDLLNVKLVRNLEQTRGGGYDLLPHKDQSGPTVDFMHKLAIECKRYGLVSPAKIREWWDQTVSQAANAGKMPVLAYRQNRWDWRIIVPIRFVDPGFPYSDELHLTLEMSIEGFSTIVREYCHSS